MNLLFLKEKWVHVWVDVAQVRLEAELRLLKPSQLACWFALVAESCMMPGVVVEET